MRDFRQSLGYIPDLGDINDLKFAAAMPHALKLPAKLTRKGEWGKIVNQGQLGSCTGNAIAGTVRWLRGNKGLKVWLPSRLALYYGERKLEGSIEMDAGAYIRDGFKVINREGTAPERLWPYKVDQFTTEPSPAYYAEAQKHQVLKYQRVDTTKLEEIKSALFAVGPIVTGISCYPSFVDSKSVMKTGLIPLPQKGEQQVGGHAIPLTGYDDERRLFEFPNSWGSSVGDHGWFYLPYDYVLNRDLCTDSWAASILEAE